MATNVTIRGNTAGPGSTQINNVSVGPAPTIEEIDRAWLRALRCPDAFAVKNRLKEKDKLLYKAIDWILQDPKYVAWHDGNDVNLLWIKGGPGKGKTMMTIGLVEQLRSKQHGSAVLLYFFCQNADYELNSVEAILKGLILRLLNQQADLKECLRRHWDTEHERFEQDLSSWRVLWNVFSEMLDRCNSSRVYVIVDALDECQGTDMARFLRLLVRQGLSHHSRVKWLLTSRPLDSANQTLLFETDQELLSLDLNSSHVAAAVETYAESRVDELDRLYKYGPKLRSEIKAALFDKAEGTFLWISLVCRQLEHSKREDALDTINALPPGLHQLYDRALQQIIRDRSTYDGCIRMLKAMLLAYRFFRLEEIPTVIGLLSDNHTIETILDQCTGFVQRRGGYAVFVHQSALDYLRGEHAQEMLSMCQVYGDDDIALSCIRCLTIELEVNLADLPRPDSKWSEGRRLEKRDRLSYAATFWMQHIQRRRDAATRQQNTTMHEALLLFFKTKALEWLECLSLVGELPRAVQHLRMLGSLFKTGDILETLVIDVARLLERHYSTIVT